MEKSRLAAMDNLRMEKLNLEVYDYLGRIKHIFDQIEEVVDKVKVYFNCESGQYFDSRFLEEFLNRKIVLENLQSIAEDITIARNTYQNFDKKIESDIDNRIEDLDINETFDFHSIIK